MLIINRMKRNSYYDIDKIFLRGLTVRDIAEPLPSFDFQTTAESVLSAMKLHHFQIAGVRENGFVTGYIERQELGDVPCGEYCHSIEESKILSGHAPLPFLVLADN
jgi:hypothetical protein